MDRDAQIKDMRLQGHTYQHIGDAYGLSRERIRQIVKGIKYVRKPSKIRMTPLERNRKYHYGITPSDYRSRLDKQHGKCAICGADITERGCVDHDHKTGRIRGIICFGCNVSLGHIESKMKLMPIIMDYLSGT